MQILTKIKEWLFGKKSERCSQCDNASTDACHAHYAQLEIDEGSAFVGVDQGDGEDETVLVYGRRLKNGRAIIDERVNSQENFYLDLMNRLRRLGYEVHQFTPYQFRIEGRLDVYPVNRKWHDIKSNKRGSYGDVIEFVRTFFNDTNV